MSIVGDSSAANEDCWLNMDSPMSYFVHPSEVCPLELIPFDNFGSDISEANFSGFTNGIGNAESIPNFHFPLGDHPHRNQHHHHQHHQQQIQQHQQLQHQFQQHQQPQQHQTVQQYQRNHPDKQLPQHQMAMVQQQKAEQVKHTGVQSHLRQQLTQQTKMAFVDPPPNLQPHVEPGVNIRKQLQLHRALSHQRQERLRARLEQEPLHLPAQIMRKPSGKKMTGRERQLELERQEAELLLLRDQYLDQMRELEQKCDKLRGILENIVTTSPEYNLQMVNLLETSDLLFDQNEPTYDDEIRL